ncbi:ThuA domain-containing protein [Zavarzinella formosa]|uniref:ThuA domain-containing protein n=1 Tax=Zavarzinella formosa TaxID=360055 RepID=UPI00030DCEC4|nr:ThuA domain-containing protein [Zavarzinella formosa]
MKAFLSCLLLVAGALSLRAEDPWIVLEPVGKPASKHVVLISGDEEYRSEEACPQLAKILSKHHGFKCTVLFAIDPKDGTISPNTNNNIPGLEALKTADLMVIFTRFRNLPDDQMKHVVDYLETGKPVIGLRTATHAFNIGGKSAFAKYTWTSKEKGWEDGFGRVVLGETWRTHHGNHGSQATLGLIAKDQEKHPILKGIKDGDIFGPTDVYGVRLPLPGDSQPLVMGQILTGMKKDSPPLAGPKNDPMMPVAWVKTYKAGEKSGRVFTTTMGASQDLLSEGVRRMLVNATYWCLGLEDKITADAKVDIVGKFDPQPFRNNGYVKNVKPADLLKD